ncbi:Uncharacterized protein BM_BM10581 [Brugia malayi]|uniref:Bm10581 n=1 Tax=Brugia malayi TaxID=6279 RepID=A0A0J9XZZ7_BRUMA|nr:Uncharacterized protein BM_BM10581 [Brugia malayi]CDP98782.1 Bm10581 [Brugia malayi]VIO98670.1 Uncharacterized protein BM_BM10581 [Brugia malayi]
MNSDHTLLTMLLSAIEFVRGGTNPSKFYSTFGNGMYYDQSDFSAHSSFLKLRDYLRSAGVARNDSLRIILSNGNIPVGHYDLKYQLHAYENVTEPPKTGKLCHLKVFEIKELSNIFIEDSEKPVNHIYWICPSYAWCCGAECCQHYYRDPWPLLGPDFYELIAAASVFASLLIIPELYRRWRQCKIDNESVLTVSEENSAQIIEDPEKAHFIV